MSSVLNINGGNGNGWNYSDQSKPGYMTSIQGTIVKITELQSRNYMTKQPEFWPDGNPKLNICFTIQGQSGRELTWVFSPKSTAFDAVVTALKTMNPNVNSIADIGGYMVEISTQEGQWGQGRPRPWTVNILGMGQVPFRGVEEYTAPPAQPVQQQQQPAQQFQPQGQQVATAPISQGQPMQQQPVIQGQPQVVPDGNGGMVYDQDIPF